MSERLLAITLGLAVTTAASRLGGDYPKGLEDFPLRTNGELNNIHLHRDLAATMALSESMRELGLSDLWGDLNSNSEAMDELVMAVVLKSGKALGRVSRQWRNLGGSVSLDPLVSEEAADPQIGPWFGFLGRACTRLGLLEHLSLAGYRRVFELR